MDDTLAAAIAQQEARKVAKAAVDETVHSQVGAQLPPVVDEKLPFIVASAMPGLVAAEYLAHPPAKGEPGLSIKGDPGEPGAKGDSVQGPKGDPGDDGQSINWRGPWQKGAYAPLDAVEYDGSSYIATSLTRTKPPGKGWDLMAKKGQDGGVKGGYNVRGFASGMVVDDEGVRLNSGAVIGEIDFAGAGVTATMSGGKALVTIPGGGGGSSLTVLDEGVVLDTAVSSIDIVGNLTATNIGHAVTITAPADLVQSVNGETGVVVLDAGDVGAVPGPQVVFVQSSDPGAVGAGALWVDTTTPGTSDQLIHRRNAFDDGWDDILGQYLASGLIILQAADAIGIFAGGDGKGLTLYASDAVNPGSAGGTFDLKGGADVDGNNGGRILGGAGSSSGGGQATLLAGNAQVGLPGGDVGLVSGSGDDGADAEASVFATGGTGLGQAGRVKVKTDGSTGNLNDVLTAQGDGTALWAPSSGGLTSPMVLARGLGA